MRKIYNDGFKSFKKSCCFFVLNGREKNYNKINSRVCLGTLFLQQTLLIIIDKFLTMVFA